VAKHFLDETAEFAMPRDGRHAAQDNNEPAATQRFDVGFREHRGLPALQRRSDDEGR
jgi:hypothetical protein